MPLFPLAHSLSLDTLQFFSILAKLKRIITLKGRLSLERKDNSTASKVMPCRVCSDKKSSSRVQQYVPSRGCRVRLRTG